LGSNEASRCLSRERPFPALRDDGRHGGMLPRTRASSPAPPLSGSAPSPPPPQPWEVARAATHTYAEVRAVASEVFQGADLSSGPAPEALAAAGSSLPLRLALALSDALSRAVGAAALRMGDQGQGDFPSGFADFASALAAAKSSLGSDPAALGRLAWACLRAPDLPALARELEDGAGDLVGSVAADFGDAAHDAWWAKAVVVAGKLGELCAGL